MSLKVFHKYSAAADFAAAEQGFFGLLWCPLGQWLSSWSRGKLQSRGKKYIMHCDPILTHMHTWSRSFIKQHSPLLHAMQSDIFLFYVIKKNIGQLYQGKWVPPLNILGFLKLDKQDCYLSFSSFLPHLICLGWFALEVGPEMQLIYLGSDIGKRNTEMRRKS